MFSSSLRISVRGGRRRTHVVCSSQTLKVRFALFQADNRDMTEADVLTPRRIVAASISRLEVDAQLRPRLCPAPCHASPQKPSLPLLVTEVLGATKPSTATIWHAQKVADSSVVNLDRAIDVAPASTNFCE